jgi:hypothetical protein
MTSLKAHLFGSDIELAANCEGYVGMLCVDDYARADAFSKAGRAFNYWTENETGAQWAVVDVVVAASAMPSTG